jgi:trehalose-6-phosphate synthase
MNTIWTKEALHSLIENRLAGTRFIVVSNREPYIHRLQDGEIVCLSPASGMATALNPILRESGGTWVAHGSGEADRLMVDDFDHVRVPPDDPQYTLRRVWLDSKLERDYYYGLSNEGLWPLCHLAFQQPVFRRADWEAYKYANEIFADVVLEEAGEGPAFVFIQDYHFGLLPRMLKNKNPNLIVAQFWHIPWPNREAFRVFPWQEELLDGLLGNDLLGFHLRYHCANFVETVDRGLEAMVDSEHADISRGGHVTLVRPFPISIDFEGHQQEAASIAVEREIDRWFGRLGGRPECLGIGIDRLDYTKGIPDRLRAIDIFLENHPEYVKRFVFVQIAVPTRSEIEDYADLEKKVDRQVAQLNAKWQIGTWQPVMLLKSHQGRASMIALHQLADFCLVTPLHDGMNLVAKEFVASRRDERGVLILSTFAGAARELSDAVQINPFATDAVADSIFVALTMPPEEQEKRMRRMRETVAENNVYRWAGKLISTLLKLDVTDRADAGESLESAEYSHTP